LSLQLSTLAANLKAENSLLGGDIDVLKPKSASLETSDIFILISKVIAQNSQKSFESDR